MVCPDEVDRLTTGSCRNPEPWHELVGPSLPLSNELVDTSAVAEADVDVAAGVDPTAVAGTAAVEACQYVSGIVQDADPGRRIVDAALADVQDALAVHGDVHGPLDVVPDGDETRHPG